MRRLLAVTLSLIAHPAAAQNVDCSTTMVQMELNQCAADQWSVADAQLNAAYKSAMALMTRWDAALPASDRGAASALRDGQRAWIVFRDKTCEAEAYAMKGGSAEPLVYYGCLRLVTIERTAQLKGLVASYTN